jgi:hypothetical protein
VSGLFKLNLPDWLKGLITAGFSAAFMLFYQMLVQGGVTVVDWGFKPGGVGNAALIGAAGYLTKNFFTTADGKALGIQATAPVPPAPAPKG